MKVYKSTPIIRSKIKLKLKEIVKNIQSGSLQLEGVGNKRTLPERERK